MGQIIKPVVEEFNPVWISFFRYGQDRNGSGEDCDITQIPETFGSSGLYRSVRFRVKHTNDGGEAFEASVMKRIDESDFKASGFLDFPFVADFGSDRFIGEPRTTERKAHRAELIAEFLNVGAKLFLHALIGPNENGFFHLEENAHFGSSFEAIRHLFCNMTDAPTIVAVDSERRWLPNPIGEKQILIRG